MKRMNRFKLNLFLLLTMILLVFSCKKEFDTPPLKNPNDGAKLFIQHLKARVTLSGAFFKMSKGDTNLICTVIADETSGNIYKTVFVKDEVGDAIQLNLISTGGLYVGDRIRINLNNKYVVNGNNMIYLDSVDVERSVVKISSGNSVNPKVVSLNDVINGTVPTASNSLQSQLVTINDVEFITADKAQPFANVITKSSVNRNVKPCGSNSQVLTVRTSGYANFANEPTPSGSGKITAIVTQYNSTMQLTIRNFNEVQMSGSGCPTPTYQVGSPVSSINENFNSIASTNIVYNETGWLNIAEEGNAQWRTDINGTHKALKATAFSSGDPNNIISLITPPIIYQSTMTMSFTTGFGFWDSGHLEPIVAFVSTNFDGTNLTTANWTAVSANYANGTGSFYPNGSTNSGVINLNSISILNGYSGNFFVAFKYKGKAGVHDSNIFLDNIRIE